MKTKQVNGVTYIIAESYTPWIMNSKLLSQNIQKGKEFGINVTTGEFCQIPEEVKYQFSIISDIGIRYNPESFKVCIDKIYTMFYEGSLKFGYIVITRTNDGATSCVPAFGQRDFLLQTLRHVVGELQKENNSVPFTLKGR